MYYYGFRLDNRQCVFRADSPVSTLQGVVIIPDAAIYSISEIFLSTHAVKGFCIAERATTAEDRQRKCKEKQQTLLEHATTKLSILCDVIGMSTDVETIEKAKEEERQWREFRVAVYTISLANPEEVVWPPFPSE